ncbi:hypothetical protein MFFDBJGM_00683 [Pectobacterium versatile]|uniref:hypothetical protein n=1 Tax=Pectobacterium versatile TaxID=2488639 RepID=UPI000DAB36E2|nr:hypothetical protein [Pectobacterium versatile]GBO47680.1 hypothetical protein MFFDBJGM_00683 [Pectobacterium versatile]
MILILTDRFDLHANIVEEKLKRPYFRLNLDVESLQETEITFSGSDWVIVQEKRRCMASKIDCVWPRRITVQTTLEQQADTSNGFRLWKGEWNKVLFGFYNFLSDADWLNHIRKATLADNKYYQTKIASEINLKTPEYITSNDKDKLLNFLANNPNSVLKFMSQDMYTSEQGQLLGLYVNKIDISDLNKFSKKAENPITIQKYINKSYEVRYTVVGDQHFACAIESQKSDKTKIDWRRYDIPNTPHTKINIPISIRVKVNELMHQLDLNFGAIDFIVDENDDWWFLEINTSGQWLWIEDLSGLDISGSIANWLTSHSR